MTTKQAKTTTTNAQTDGDDDSDDVQFLGVQNPPEVITIDTDEENPTPPPPPPSNINPPRLKKPPPELPQLPHRPVGRQSRPPKQTQLIRELSQPPELQRPQKQSEQAQEEPANAIAAVATTIINIDLNNDINNNAYIDHQDDDYSFAPPLSIICPNGCIKRTVRAVPGASVYCNDICLEKHVKGALPGALRSGGRVCLVDRVRMAQSREMVLREEEAPSAEALVCLMKEKRLLSHSLVKNMSPAPSQDGRRSIEVVDRTRVSKSSRISAIKKGAKQSLMKTRQNSSQSKVVTNVDPSSGSSSGSSSSEEDEMEEEVTKIQRKRPPKFPTSASALVVKKKKKSHQKVFSNDAEKNEDFPSSCRGNRTPQQEEAAAVLPADRREASETELVQKCKPSTSSGQGSAASSSTTSAASPAPQVLNTYKSNISKSTCYVEKPVPCAPPGRAWKNFVQEAQSKECVGPKVAETRKEKREKLQKKLEERFKNLLPEEQARLIDAQQRLPTLRLRQISIDIEQETWNAKGGVLEKNQKRYGRHMLFIFQHISDLKNDDFVGRILRGQLTAKTIARMEDSSEMKSDAEKAAKRAEERRLLDAEVQEAIKFGLKERDAHKSLIKKTHKGDIEIREKGVGLTDMIVDYPGPANTATTSTTTTSTPTRSDNGSSHLHQHLQRYSPKSPHPHQSPHPHKSPRYHQKDMCSIHHHQKTPPNYHSYLSPHHPHQTCPSFRVGMSLASQCGDDYYGELEPRAPRSIPLVVIPEETTDPTMVDPRLDQAYVCGRMANRGQQSAYDQNEQQTPQVMLAPHPGFNEVVDTAWPFLRRPFPTTMFDAGSDRGSRVVEGCGGGGIDWTASNLNQQHPPPPFMSSSSGFLESAFSDVARSSGGQRRNGSGGKGNAHQQNANSRF